MWDAFGLCRYIHTVNRSAKADTVKDAVLAVNVLIRVIFVERVNRGEIQTSLRIKSLFGTRAACRNQ